MPAVLSPCFPTAWEGGLSARVFGRWAWPTNTGIRARELVSAWRAPHNLQLPTGQLYTRLAARIPRKCQEYCARSQERAMETVREKPQNIRRRHLDLLNAQHQAFVSLQASSKLDSKMHRRGWNAAETERCAGRRLT